MSQNPPSLVRDFLRSELPLLPGQYFSRPGPGHILNNFAVHALGTGLYGNGVARLVGAGEGLDDIFDDVSSAGDRDAALSLLKAIFNSDGNVYSSFSSPFLTSAAFAKADASDDGYAMGLWRSIGPDNRAAIQAVMADLFSAAGSTDVVSKVSQAIIGSLEAAAPSKTKEGPSDEGTPFGLEAGKLLQSGLERMRATSGNASRIEDVRLLSIMLGGLVILGMLYDPIVAGWSDPKTDHDQQLPTPGDALGIFVYTGETPGHPQHALVGLAVRSIDDAILRAHDGYASTFERVLKQEMRASRRRAKEDQLVDAVTARMQGEGARRFTALLREGDAANAAAAFARSTIELSRLRSSIKSLGYKVGVSAPQRAGSLRLVLETNFLTALTYFLVEEDMDVQSFVDKVYQRLGLIVGEPQNMSSGSYDRLAGIAGRAFDIEQSMADGQEMLRRRLIRSGLAREYSDGFTLLGEL